MYTSDLESNPDLMCNAVTHPAFTDNISLFTIVLFTQTRARPVYDRDTSRLIKRTSHLTSHLNQAGLDNGLQIINISKNYTGIAYTNEILSNSYTAFIHTVR